MHARSAGLGAWSRSLRPLHPSIECRESPVSGADGHDSCPGAFPETPVRRLPSLNVLEGVMRYPGENLVHGAIVTTSREKRWGLVDGGIGVDGKSETC